MPITQIQIMKNHCCVRLGFSNFHDQKVTDDIYQAKKFYQFYNKIGCEDVWKNEIRSWVWNMIDEKSLIDYNSDKYNYNFTFTFLDYHKELRLAEPEHATAFLLKFGNFVEPFV
jgi:hypothetical protein